MFYDPQGHPYDCFPMGLIYMYILVSLACMHCIRSKEVTSFRGLGQLMGVVCNQMHAIELYRPAERKLLVVYVETGTVTISCFS